MTYTVPPGRYSAPASLFIKEYIDVAIADLIDSAPDSLNTLKEFAEALENNPEAFTDLNATIQAEIDRATASEVALGVEINDEEIARAAAVAAVTNAVQAEQARAEAAEAAEAIARQAAVDVVTAALNASVADELASRDALEAEDVRLQNALDTEIAERLAGDIGENDADILLSARLDVLESDPITKTESVAADALSVTAAAAYTDNAINNLVGGASSALDTLKELEDALTGNDSEIATLVTQISDETTARIAADAVVQADVDQNEIDSDAADTALSGRLDVLEVDPTTQALLDAEIAARIAGDDALRDELFPSPACPYQDIQATVTAGDETTAEDGNLHYNAADKKLYIPNDLRKSGTAPNQTNVWPYGPGETPPDSSIYINLVGNVVVSYSNTSGVVYAELTDDISALIGTEIVIRWCSPDADLPYVLPEELDVEIARINSLETAGVWYFADQAAFPAAADNHGRVVHSHADGAQYFSHGGAWIQIADENDIQELENRLFPSPECPYESLTYEVSAGDYNTAEDGKFHYDAAQKKLYIPNDIRKSGTAPNQVDIWPYGTNGSPMPPDGNFYIDGVANVAVTYANTSGVVYAGLTDDIASLIGTEITIRWCPAEANLPYALPEAVDLKADKSSPDFTGQVDIDTNARIEFADNLTKIHNVLRGTSINIGNNIELIPAAAGGRVEITGDLVLDASDLTNAADDTAAAAAGVVVGQIYHNSGALRVRLS
jgi:hypothetical protein